MKKLDKTGLPFAPISKPEDLFDDPHLNESGGLLDVEIPSGGSTKLPAMPINMNDRRFDVHTPVPKVGEHSDQILKELGLDDEEIRDLFNEGVVSKKLSFIAFNVFSIWSHTHKTSKDSD